MAEEQDLVIVGSMPNPEPEWVRWQGISQFCQLCGRSVRSNPEASIRCDGCDFPDCVILHRNQSRTKIVCDECNSKLAYPLYTKELDFCHPDRRNLRNKHYARLESNRKRREARQRLYDEKEKRLCVTCKEDISDTAPQRKRCAECSVKLNRSRSRANHILRRMERKERENGG